MTVKEHYDKHLGNFYSWMTGNFDDRKNEFMDFCAKHEIKPASAGDIAVDLGAGNGIQSIALAELGYVVKAVDFCEELLDELTGRAQGFNINVINGDIRAITEYSRPAPDIIICCGDTLTHLDSIEDITHLIKDSYNALNDGGEILLSFRDYSAELEDTARFIPVKSDDERILTCFLEYFPARVKVTDLLHEKINNAWVQKVSSYWKVRVDAGMITGFLADAGFNIRVNKVINRMIYIIGKK